MKKHYLLGMAFAALVLPAMGQVRSAAPAEKLLSAPIGLMAPVWSPDGSKIAVTSDNYEGIYVANADGSDLHMVNAEKGAGYRMAWNADGIVDGKKMKAAAKASTVYDTMVAAPAEAASKIAALKEFEGRTVINPALSPDGTRIAFQIVGKGMWMINADGTGLRSLGRGSHPAWMPDSRTIVYTIVEDNGNQFTASTLMSANTDNGHSAVVLASDGLVPLTPAIAPDGSKVAFENAADASIYVVKLKK